MRQVDPLDLPQARVAPVSVLRGLAEIDDRLTLMHSRANRWLVLRYAPEKIDQQSVTRTLGNWHRAAVEGRGLGPDGNARVRQALLARLGWKIVHVYTVNDPDGRIVEDVRRSGYALQNAHADAPILAEAAEKDARRRAGYAAITDEGRARDAHGFLTRSSFGAAVDSVRGSRVTRSSARTLHRSIT